MKRQNVVTDLAARRRRPKPVTFSDTEMADMRRLAREGYGPQAIATFIKRSRDEVGVWLIAQGFNTRGATFNRCRVSVITLPHVDGADT